MPAKQRLWKRGVSPRHCKGRQCVYLLHFITPHVAPSGHKVSHYVGFTTQIERRMLHHERGTGAKLLRALHKDKAGRQFVIVRVWIDANRTIERAIKNYKKNTLLCPICNNRAKYFGNDLTGVNHE